MLLRAMTLLSWGMIVARAALAQTLPAPDDSRHSMLREAMLGLLPDQVPVPDSAARRRCLTLPVDQPDDRLQGPHGDSLVSSRCRVVSYKSLNAGTAGPWFAAQYEWTSVFTAEDSSRGASARDTVIESEALLLSPSGPALVRPVWHQRFESDGYGLYRSIWPEIGWAKTGILLTVITCVNGTGGCSQEFLRQHPDGRWAPVWQIWPDQLPQGFAARLEHGFRIDPQTLKGDAAFYGPHDANCCPSQLLHLELSLSGDSLALRSHSVGPAPR